MQPVRVLYLSRPLIILSKPKQLIKSRIFNIQAAAVHNRHRNKVSVPNSRVHCLIQHCDAALRHTYHFFLAAFFFSSFFIELFKWDVF